MMSGNDTSIDPTSDYIPYCFFKFLPTCLNPSKFGHHLKSYGVQSIDGMALCPIAHFFFNRIVTSITDIRTEN